jgi:small GTP-binding protein
VTSTLDRTLTVAVAGNPNSGKTTIFNNLTGARQHVGNYPGVTVEWKEGLVRRGDLRLNLVDLPGTYSLTAFSEEELVARDYLLNHAPDVVINVVDASNLDRNLYLTTELLEIGRPVVVVLNMSDAARDRGMIIDHHRLSQRLGVPVVPAVGNRNQGMDGIIGAVLEAANSRVHLPGTADQCRDAGPGLGSLAAPQRAIGGHVNYGPTDGVGRGAHRGAAARVAASALAGAEAAGERQSRARGGDGRQRAPRRRRHRRRVRHHHHRRSRHPAGAAALRVHRAAVRATSAARSRPVAAWR